MSGYVITEAAVRNGHVFKRLGFFSVKDDELSVFLDAYREPRANWSRDYFIMRKHSVIDGWLIDVLVRWDKVP